MLQDICEGIWDPVNGPGTISYVRTWQDKIHRFQGWGPDHLWGSIFSLPQKGREYFRDSFYQQCQVLLKDRVKYILKKCPIASFRETCWAFLENSTNTEPQVLCLLKQVSWNCHLPKWSQTVWPLELVPSLPQTWVPNTRKYSPVLLSSHFQLLSCSLLYLPASWPPPHDSRLCHHPEWYPHTWDQNHKLSALWRIHLQ